jgi:hypothetical protein
MAKNTAKTAETTLNMQATVGEIDLSDDGMLAAMLAETVAETEAAPVITLDDEAAIEAAIGEIEQTEALHEHYAAAEAPADTAASDTPKTEPKKGKGKGKGKKAAPEAAAPKEAAPKEPVIRYNGRKTNASDVLNARLGGKVGEMLILEVEDATLEQSELEAKQAELLALLDTRPNTKGAAAASQQKVAEKVVMLFGWLKNGGALNKVMDITLRTLVRDGEIVSGEKGNLHKELLAKPYSKGTANAQSGQMMAMLPMLKIATKADKGKLLLNPNSLVLQAARAQLGL